MDEVDLKCGTRDSTLGSLVFPRSKGGEADDEPLPGSLLQPKTLLFDANLNTKKKRSSVLNERCLHSIRSSGAGEPLKGNPIFLKSY